MAAAKKKTTEDGRKQLTLRVSPENYKRVQMARINDDLTLQRLLFDAVDGWLRRNKHEPLLPEEPR